MTPRGKRSLRPMARRFFAVSARLLARRLLGALIVRVLDDGRVLAARVVETEAYVGPQDRASHAAGGRRTARTEPMYARPGTSYVYFTYGMHHCFNVVCERAGFPAAVLIRAAEPVSGLEAMVEARPGVRVERLLVGPGNLCRALRIDRSLNSVDLTRDRRLRVCADPNAPVAGRPVARTARIGVGSAGAWAAARLRWVLADSSALSRQPARQGKASSARATIVSTRTKRARPTGASRSGRRTEQE